MFITVFTTVCHCSLSWAGSSQSTISRPAWLKSIIILHSQLCPTLPSGLFPSGFPNKYCMQFYFIPCVLHAPPISPSFFDHPNNIWCSVHNILLKPRFIIFPPLWLATRWNIRCRGLDSRRRLGILVFSIASGRVWCPPSLLFDGYWGLFFWGREADHSPPSSAEVKNGWIYTSTSPIRLHGVVLS